MRIILRYTLPGNDVQTYQEHVGTTDGSSVPRSGDIIKWSRGIGRVVDVMYVYGDEAELKNWSP